MQSYADRAPSKAITLRGIRNTEQETLENLETWSCEVDSVLFSMLLPTALERVATPLEIWFGCAEHATANIKGVDV